MKKVLAFLLLLSFLPVSAEAYWVWSPEAGKFINSEGPSQDLADEQYHAAMQFYKEKNLDQAAEQFEELLKKYPSASIASEAKYRLGMVHEEKGDYWKAFQTYKNLLQTYPYTERLVEIVEREYRIANLFLSGKKAKLMGLEILPSLPRAVEIYKHIVDQAPYSEFGDKAQFRMALAYKKWNHFDEAIDAFQGLIDQYPKSELVGDAQFQLAETSFLRSSAEFRDQRALDEASTQVDSFLTRYPDTNTSEKAAKIRQEIDEKNAEKNYRIGLYYEKDNYVESALIYYADVAARYPHTQWGEKASVKLQSLKEPASYLTTQEEEIKKEITIAEAEIKGLGEQDSFEKDRLKRQLERLKERQKSVEKNKGESLDRRHADLKRRASELKAKFKKLDKKKKLLKKNPSEDLKQALDRWTASLESEQATLEEEKRQLTEWRETLGVKSPRVFSLEFLPFIGEPPSAMDKIRTVEAKKFYKISDEKKVLLSEKELLYKQHSEIFALLQNLETKRLGLTDEETEFLEIVESGSQEAKVRYEALKKTREEIKLLENALNEKSVLYENQFGKQGWLSWAKAPTQVVTASAGVMGKSIGRSLDILNPFDDSGSSPLQKKSLEELLERRMHLKEKMAAQQSLVDTLSHAFNTELALQEQKRLLQTLESDQTVDLMQLRKSIKRLEKDIRSRYKEIEDRHQKKNELLEELENLFKQREADQGPVPQAARAVASPAVGILKLSRAFFFGLPNRDVALTHSAKALPADDATSQRAKKIKEDIEMESLLIEARSRELVTLQKELEILRAKASLTAGVKFRSAIVTVPYQFIKEAIEGANRMVPKKNREEMLIGLLDRETHELESSKAELTQIEKLIDGKSEAYEPVLDEVQTPVSPQPPKESSAVQPVSSSSASGLQPETRKQESELKHEIQRMVEKLQMRREVYEREKAILETERKVLSQETGQAQSQKAWQNQNKELSKQEEKLHDELKEIEENLQDLIQKEGELEKEESSILQKRIQTVDQVIQGVHSKAIQQDLLTERERMEERLSQLELRRDFLSKEIKRFQLAQQGAVVNP